MRQGRHQWRDAWMGRTRGALLAGALLLGLSGPEARGAMQGPPDPQLRQLLKEAAADTSAFDDRFQAEVWLMDMSQRLRPRIANPDERLGLLKVIHQEARRAELPPELVLAVIDVESDFDRYAISHAGARGLMQVMPFWLNEIGRPEDNLFKIRTNLRFGCTILRYYLDKARGDLREALARYNGSLGRRYYPDKVFQALRRHWYRQ